MGVFGGRKETGLQNDIISKIKLSFFFKKKSAYCSALKKKKKDPQRAIRKSGLIGVGVTLLREVSHCGGWARQVPLLKLHSVWYTHFLLPVA